MHLVEVLEVMGCRSSVARLGAKAKSLGFDSLATPEIFTFFLRFSLNHFDRERFILVLLFLQLLFL